MAEETKGTETAKEKAKEREKISEKVPEAAGSAVTVEIGLAPPNPSKKISVFSLFSKIFFCFFSLQPNRRCS